MSVVLTGHRREGGQDDVGGYARSECGCREKLNKEVSVNV